MLRVGSKEPQVGDAVLRVGSTGFAIYQLARAGMNIVSGSYPFAAMHGATAAVMLYRPRLVAKALRTPLRAPEAPVVAAALQAVLRVFRPQPTAPTSQPQQAQGR
jgi:hypothetical protein